MCADKPLRAFVIYRHPIFAHGVRDFLSRAPSIRIVGMELESAGVIEAARSLKPDVVILEEPVGEFAPLHAVLEIRTAQRVVTLSLGHTVASVYQARRVRVARPAAVVAAVRGTERGMRSAMARAGKEVISGRNPT